MGFSRKQIERHKEAARRSWTKDNYIGARKLAYDLRNHSADYVARQHIQAEDAAHAARERGLRADLEARAAEAVGDVTRIQVSTGGLAPQSGFAPNLKERTRYLRVLEDGAIKEYKVIERYHDGALVEEQIVPL